MIVDNNYDIFIVSADKDYNKLAHVIDAAKTNLVDFDGEIYVVSPTPLPANVTGVRESRDEDVLDVDRSRFPRRPNWTFQQFLKLFQDVTQRDSYLVLDAYTIVNRPLSMFLNDHPVFYLGIEQMHQPYFEFMRKVMGLPRSYNHTFINEFMLMNKQVIAQLLQPFGGDTTDFYEQSILNMNAECYLSELELYGNFVYQAYPELYQMRKISSKRHGVDRHPYTISEIEDVMRSMKGQPVDVFTMHSWY